jgi:hypothetical protein
MCPRLCGTDQLPFCGRGEVRDGGVRPPLSQLRSTGWHPEASGDSRCSCFAPRRLPRSAAPSFSALSAPAHTKVQLYSIFSTNGVPVPECVQEVKIVNPLISEFHGPGGGRGLLPHMQPATNRAGIDVQLFVSETASMLDCAQVVCMAKFPLALPGTFRHSVGSLLGQSGENVKVVQELLRHASSRLTQDVYQQADQGAKRSALSRFSSVLAFPAKKSA